MTVPKTAVDENDGVVFGEDDVGGAREAAVVYAVAETEAPEGVTQFQLRLRRSGVNGRHVAMALVGSVNVRHAMQIYIDSPDFLQLIH